MEASEGRETERMAKSAVQSAAKSLTYFIQQKDFHLSHVEDSARTLRNKLNALFKDVDGMRGYNESVQLIKVANDIKNVIDSFICNIAEQRGETSAGWMNYQSTFNSGIKDKPAIEELGKKIFDLKTRLDDIILSNTSQYGVHNIQQSGEASTSSNQSKIQREKSFIGRPRSPFSPLPPVPTISAAAESPLPPFPTISAAAESPLLPFPTISAATESRNLKRRLDEIILPNRSQYDIHNIQPCGEASTSSNQSQIQREKRAPIVNEAEVVGFEDETRKLVERLITGDKRRVVISITGPGGIGKTTLAKKVYDNIQVRKSFGVRCWMNVHQESLVRDILFPCIRTFYLWFSMEKMSEEDLRRELSGYLERKRYLVVIDGIWSKEVWDGLVTAFPDRENGSRVLLTTCNEEVAKYADTQSTPHKLRFLNENESWTLFCKKALLLGNPSPAWPPNLEELGRMMVAKCEGLPLAIAVLGGILSRKEKSVDEWEKVFRSVGWRLHQSEEDAISVIFALGYHDMPNYLKPCFLYFGAFHGNSKISVCELVRIWIAEGFVQGTEEKEMEDVAEDYVEELISRSMIQVSQRKSNGMVETCRIHDHLRDLAISKAEEERFLEVYGNKVPTSSIMADRLAITSGDISNCISLNSSTPHLLSLLDFSYESKLIEKLALKIPGGSFKFLRVLHLQSKKRSRLPDEIGDLIHLRYLRLEMPWLEYQASTITRLCNLQTLDIEKYSFSLKWQVDDIVKMEQMRHLMVRDGWFSSGMQLHHSSNNLQTLSSVSAGRWIEDGLEKMTNLRDLEIINIRGDVHMALSRSISKLVHLRSLSLRTRFTSQLLAFESFSKHEHLYKMTLKGRLEKLPEPHEFPPNLTELCLERSKLDRDPMVTLEKLPNLRILRICGNVFDRDAYMGKEIVCSAGGFPLLDTLTIDGFHELEEWRVEEGAMRNLRCLKISSCERLKMLPYGLRYLITLQELKLEDMSEEMKERVRKNEGEDWFKIGHIAILIIE